jgi:heterodisulfide reductase subunit A
MTDSILIVGGGIAGLHAAMECANAGARAIVVEREPIVGGRLAATMTEASAIGDRAEGVQTPLFAKLADYENIEIITLANLEKIDGRPGNFTVSIREAARFVTDACTRCKLCRVVCPVVLANEFDAGLTYRKAIYTPMAETMPDPYVIDIENCLNTPPNYQPCQRCVEVCEDDAIFFNLVDTVHERQVGAVILAPGFQIEDGTTYTEFGYGTHADIVTSAELQRLMESPGPTGGFASKPSNEEYPDSVLLVLDNPSPFALYIVASQVHQLLEQDIETVTVLVLSQLTQDSELANVQQLAEKTGVQVRWGATFKADPAPENALAVSYEDFSANRYVQETYDMVVLCSDVQPIRGLDALAECVDVKLADNGYIAVMGKDRPGITTSQPGIFVAGCASGPRNIKDSIATARAAASAAVDNLDQRLLQPDDEAQQTTKVTELGAAPVVSPPDLSENEQRARIEQMLYALLGKADA